MNSKQKIRIGVFAGSFDPFTKGHLSIVEQVMNKDCPLFDKLFILITTNSSKTSFCSSSVKKKDY